MPALKLHSQLNLSYSNGPGARFVLWVQGCSLGCPGCFNPETHDFDRGELVAVQDLVGKALKLKTKIEGITISGGEPFQQPEALFEFLKEFKERSDLSVLVFSGFTLSEIEEQPSLKRSLPYIDVLIAGRYAANLVESNKWLGSANQQQHLLTDRYTQEDLQSVPKTEVQISSDGEIRKSGIDPLG